MDGNGSHGKLHKRRTRSKSTRFSKGAHRDRDPSIYLWKKILNLFSADALVIQAVADALNLTLDIIESNPGFASVTNISPVRATVINIEHLDKIDYVPTQFPSTNQPLYKHHNKITLTQNALLTH